MGYLLTEIVVYLVIAGLIGFAFGWAVKAGALDKYFDKLVAFINKIWTAIKGLFKKSDKTKEDVKETKEEVAPAKVAEVIKEEVQAAEPIKEELKDKVVEEAVVEVSKELETEVIKEEVKTEEPSKVEEEIVETVVETNKPTLLSEAPEKGADTLAALKGIGPVLEKKLNGLGIYTYEQISSWTTEQEIWVGTQISFPKKVIKEQWVQQAKELLEAK